MSHINRRKFIRLSCTACAALPLLATGIPTIGEASIPVLWNNDPNKVIGKVIDLEEDEGGYMCTMELSELIIKKLHESDGIRFASMSIKENNDQGCCHHILLERRFDR